VADRVISVRLRLEVDDARRNAKAAGDAFRGIASAAEAAGRSDAFMSRLGSSAKAAGRAIATIGGVAVGGMAALTASTVKTGIGYNTLEQTSRAALKTVLGSASAASGQMERLREFGKTSPFPRQVWISAQQQLLAFGMSAEKIIPTFQAVQDAVAAAGGGGQQITEVVDILAKVQSTGKVTAETLNELGYRGIDAATLIGNAMGKTAAEVREDISNQAIAGVDFIDQLTSAMSTRFAGAAAGVKQTWEGAKDRIKGAVRDIGSLLASPLVDPDGGGAFVDWANGAADALRALEARLGPVIQAFRDRADPAFDSITQKLQDLADWIKNADFSRIGEQIQGVLPAITGVTAGIAAMGAKSLPVIGNMVGGLKPLPVALVAAAMASPGLRSALMDLLGAATPLIEVIAKATEFLAGAFSSALTVVAALLQPVIAVVSVLGNVLGALPGPIQTVIGALILFKGLQMTGHLSGLTTAFKNFGSEMQAQKQYASMAGQSIGNVNAAYSVAASGVTKSVNGIKGALTSVGNFLAGPWGVALSLGIGLLSSFGAASTDAAADQQGLAGALQAGTGAITAQTREWVLNKLETEGIANTYRKAGGDVQDLVDAYLGAPGAVSKVTGVLRESSRTAGISAGDYKHLLEVLGAAPDTLDAARGAAKDKAGADEEGAYAADKAAVAHGGLSYALSASGAAATDAATRIQQLNADLAAYNQANFGFQEAHDKWASGINGLGKMFEKNNQATTKSTGSADKYSDSLKRQAKVTADAKKQLQDLAEAQRKAEQEAREAAEAAKQRRLDELFGKQFDVQSTRDAFSSSLAQAAKDIREAKKERVAGATSLTGLSEGALGNRDRMRSLVQQAQSVIQAEMDRGASKQRISAVTRDLQAQLANQAKSWGLNAREVKAYTQAIAAFGGVANTTVRPNLAAVRKEYAAQRAELKANTAEQIASAKESARSASAASGATAAVEKHTAALDGDSESAIENREFFRQRVKDAQAELTQMSAQGASRQEITKRAKELARELDTEAAKYGFNKKRVREYTDSIRDSAVVISRYPTLIAKVNTAGALTTIRNFQKGVDRAMARIKKNYQLGLTTAVPGTSRFLPGLSHTGGHAIAATGGYIRGPGGPKGDKIPAMLSDTEFVQQADAVRYYGVDFMHAVNQRQIPKGAIPGFAGGGPVALDTKFKLAGGMGRAIAGIRNAFRDELYGGFFGAMPSGSISGSIGGSGVQRWAPLVLEVLRMLRQPISLLPNVLRRMNQESGGNPRAINLWDSNAARGTPSIGLMQTIGPTFAAYAGPFRSRGIYDPLANIYAGINYAINRYGSLQYAMDKPGGYRSGGLVEKIPTKKLGMPADFMRGSYRRGTPYVPMDGMYQLHRGEQVTPAGQGGPQTFVLELRPDGSKWSDLVVDTVHKADTGGRLHIRVRR
jgi:tape measure domain-containing protein